MQAIVTVLNLIFAFTMGLLAFASLYGKMNHARAANLAMNCAVVLATFYVLFGVYAALHHSWLWLYTPFVLLGVAGLAWFRWKVMGVVLHREEPAEDEEPPTP